MSGQIKVKSDARLISVLAQVFCFLCDKLCKPKQYFKSKLKSLALILHSLFTHTHTTIPSHKRDARYGTQGLDFGKKRGRLIIQVSSLQRDRGGLR